MISQTVYGLNKLYKMSASESARLRRIRVTRAPLYKQNKAVRRNN